MLFTESNLLESCRETFGKNVNEARDDETFEFTESD